FIRRRPPTPPLFPYTTLFRSTELVAADARQRVAFAQAALQQHADLAHELVARRVAAGIVDDLELIEIEIQHRVRSPQIAGARQSEAQPVLEFSPVDQPGQRIVARLVRE